MKYDILEVHKDRLNEIDKRIQKAIYKKDWFTKEIMEKEKKAVQKTIKEIEDSRNGRE